MPSIAPAKTTRQARTTSTAGPAAAARRRSPWWLRRLPDDTVEQGNDAGSCPEEDDDTNSDEEEEDDKDDPTPAAPEDTADDNEGDQNPFVARSGDGSFVSQAWLSEAADTVSGLLGRIDELETLLDGNSPPDGDGGHAAPRKSTKRVASRKHRPTQENLLQEFLKGTRPRTREHCSLQVLAQKLESDQAPPEIKKAAEDQKAFEATRSDRKSLGRRKGSRPSSSDTFHKLVEGRKRVRVPLDTALLKLGKGRAIFRSLKLRLRRNVKKLALPFPRELLRPHCVDGQFSGSVKVWDKSTPLLLLSDFDHRSIVVSVYDDAGGFLFNFDYDQLSPAGLGHWLVFIEWLATVSEGPQVEEGDQHRQPPLPRELLRPHSSNGVFSGYVKLRATAQELETLLEGDGSAAATASSSATTAGFSSAASRRRKAGRKRGAGFEQPIKTFNALASGRKKVRVSIDSCLCRVSKHAGALRHLKLLHQDRRLRAVHLPLPRALLAPHACNGIFDGYATHGVLCGFAKVSCETSEPGKPSWLAENVHVSIYSEEGVLLFVYCCEDLSDAGVELFYIFAEWLALTSEELAASQINPLSAHESRRGSSRPLQLQAPAFSERHLPGAASWYLQDGIFRGFLRVSDVSVSNVQASSFAEELLIITVYDIAGAPLFSYGLRELSDAGAGHWEVLCEWLALGSQAMIPKGTNTTPARRPPGLERSRRTL
ncbi:hypothetical protein A1Q1_03211 [Trichosporon asahii var. asahii CBS 2479]|uniref:Uncharacterized protein n=1 Tax=Trichosporon asahii var. asahii (strain ATCC 90039 / CBS 2479 / JCM 2466 / KCTC 7840 / NBRC 103889/ NCYC 2677 / UAMH 7654) TaxID=1186058 RepID=J4UAT1_TRIAS|nr:hypothetical protein A1Q1_03211 [Trichosporon asahii var. asahii CBS 2479]EJT47905.1 hypothetical protein A1Q1_03211 [Trichosporon asahii var. asahii CBS 2479]